MEAFYEADERVHEAFSLAQWKMKGLTDKQGGSYREIGIFLRPTTDSGLARVQSDWRFLGKRS